MNKINSNEIKSLFIDLNDRSSDNSISEKIAELKNSGLSEIQLEVKNSPEYDIQNLQLDIDLFIKIKAIQDLPDWVIIKLILAEGKLKGSKFSEQIHGG
ncbi:MAG: hypothetical protein OQJ78_05230, partial [Ignavibacteriaceae bacterium]|nr:hypothetical protein [Ignavibacteriaceae bacterium]